MPAKSTSRRKPAPAHVPPADAEAPTAISDAPPPEGGAAKPAVRRVSKKIAVRKAPAEASSAGEPHSAQPKAPAHAAPEATTPDGVIEVVREAAISQVFEDRSEFPPGDSGWPEPETVGAGEQDGGSKRKRRRRKGKGKGQPQGAPPSEDAFPHRPAATDVGQPAAIGESQPPPRPAAPQARVKMDPELLAKFAWKIFLAEVSEEGSALINDREAREVARRCFKLAEIFLEEQGRQSGGR